MQWFKPDFFQLLWLVPFLILLLVFGQKKRRNLLRTFGYEKTIQNLIRAHAANRYLVKNTLLVLAVVFFILSLAQPQWGEEKKQLKRKGIDLIFLVDTSLSMLAQDVKPNRIEKIKFILKAFLKNLKGDRVGIVTFAGSGFLQSPLTLDYSAFLLFANAIQVGFIPDPGTNISNGLDIAIRSFPKNEKKHKAIIILSDGETLEGKIDDVADTAKKSGVRIYAIGIGTPDGEPIPLRSQDGKVSGYKKDERGEIVVTKLNEELLQRITKGTDGLYFRASASEAEVDLIYQHLQSLGKKELKERIMIEREDRYQSFLLIGFILLLLETILGDRVRGKTERDTIL